jgi:hypothetical protein
LSDDRRDVRLLTGLLLGLGLTLLAVTLRLGAPEREGVSLLVADGGASTWARLSRGNGGVLEGQVTTRLVRLGAGAPQAHRAQRPPAPAAGEGLEAGPDAFTPDGSGDWELRVGGDSLRARLRVRGASTECPPRPGWAAGAITGEGEGATVQGPAIVLRSASRFASSPEALWLVGTEATAGVDPAGACPAWARLGGESWSGAALPPPLRRGDSAQLGPFRLELLGREGAAPMDPLAQLSAFERLLARPFVGPPAQLVRVRARLTLGGEARDLAGMLLVRADPPR